MKVIGQRLEKANRQPISLLLGGRVVRLQVWVKNLIYDGPEAKKAALVLSGCNTCMAPKIAFALPTAQSLHAARTTESMKSCYMKCQSMIANRSNGRC